MNPLIEVFVLSLFSGSAQIACQADESNFSSLNTWLKIHGYHTIYINPVIWHVMWIKDTHQMRRAAKYNLSLMVFRTETREKIENFIRKTQILAKIETLAGTSAMDGCFYNQNFGIAFKVEDESNLKALETLNGVERLKAYIQLGERYVEVDAAGGFFYDFPPPRAFFLEQKSKKIVLESYFALKPKAEANLRYTGSVSTDSVEVAYEKQLKYNYYVAIMLEEKRAKEVESFENIKRELPADATLVLKGMRRSGDTLLQILNKLRIVSEKYTDKVLDSLEQSLFVYRKSGARYPPTKNFSIRNHQSSPDSSKI